MDKDPQQFGKKELKDKREAFDKLMKRRFFFSQAFEIYGGVGGLYDYGPPGCAIKSNLQQYWREHFILEEDMLEVSTSCINPESVFKASGHLKKFTDLLVRDEKTKAGYRADKLLEEFIDKKLEKEKKKLKEEEVKELLIIQNNADNYSAEEIQAVFEKLKIKAPETNNNLTPPEPFNLMFATDIGPSGTFKGYLRPETAQGMFLNFNKLLEYNNNKIPCAGAQLGLGFRNEIAPRGGLFRCREFDMAEIEHFFDPEDGSHPKFETVKDLSIKLLHKEDQEKDIFEPTSMCLGEAVEKGIISNETHAYFIGRTYLFLTGAGINKNNLRFRQHRNSEMAHYANDCWDAECETSSGYIEIVGIGNRGAYDLNAHSQGSGKTLNAARMLKEPKAIVVYDVVLDKGPMGKELKKDGSALIRHIECLDNEEKKQLQIYFEEEKNEQKAYTINEKEIILKKSYIKKFTQENKNIIEEKFIPNVIEPAFGIGRIIMCILEHNFYMRDKERTFLQLPPRIAPIKVSILPVMKAKKYVDCIKQIKTDLIKHQISSKIDDAGQTIGRRYARTDELGIPFGITIDDETLSELSVTVREIKTTKQVRIKLSEVTNVIWSICEGFMTWDEVLEKYPAFNQKVEE